MAIIHEWFTPDPENDFNIISTSQKRGTFLAGLSVGGKMGPVDLRIGYEGEFNSDVTSHSGFFKFVLPLGGHAAPPPPPPPPPPRLRRQRRSTVVNAASKQRPVHSIPGGSG
jgi:hypothetical protein